jgi:DNA-binding CsgD family transcriptional regulator
MRLPASDQPQRCESLGECPGRLAARALDLLDIGAVIVDERLRLLFLNSAAKDMVRRGDGLVVQNGALRTQSHDDCRNLGEAVRRAAQPRSSEPRTSLVSVTRLATSVPLQLCVAPIIRTVEPSLNGCYVAVFAIDAARPISPPSHLLKDAFGISSAEARLALALANGETPKEYAASRNLGLPTVRTQLQSLFAKTGTRRQSELMRTLIRALACVSLAVSGA